MGSAEHMEETHLVQLSESIIQSSEQEHKSLCCWTVFPLITLVLFQNTITNIYVSIW